MSADKKVQQIVVPEDVCCPETGFIAPPIKDMQEIIERLRVKRTCQKNATFRNLFSVQFLLISRSNNIALTKLRFLKYSLYRLHFSHFNLLHAN